MKPSSALKFAQCVVYFAALLSLAAAAERPSILTRFPVTATNVLGERLTGLFGRLEQFDLEPEPNVPLPPLPSTPKGALPGGNIVTAAIYETVVEPPANNAKATSTLIVLHGMGGTPQELRLLAYPARRKLPRTRFVFVKAPKQYVTYMRKETTSWFNVIQRRPGFEVVPELRAAAAGVARLVRLEREKHGIPGNKVVLLGMSQGGGVVLTFYLAERTRVAGVIGTATWLPLPTKWERAALPRENAATPCFIQHGTKDAVIPVGEAFDSAKKLKELGRRTRYKEYQGGGHSLMERFSTVVSDIFDETKRMIGE